MRAARLLGGLALLLAMLGWSAWFVICNVYEFAPDLDPLAWACGWLLSAVLVWRVGRRAAWPLFAWAACIGLYLLLIHRGVAEGVALSVLMVAGIGVIAVPFRSVTRKH